jgi:hypothetical protein
MAINFLNSVNLNQNELIKARIENQPNNAAAGTGTEGQLYYDTTVDVLKVWASGAWTEVGGGVVSLTLSDSTFISLSNSGTAANPIVTAALSATGTPSSSKYLRGDNTWATLPGPPTITLTGDVTGSGTTSITTTIGSGAVEFSMIDPAVIITSGEGIAGNNNDITLPTSAAVKSYVDSSTTGALIFQGGYDAATNTPNLDSPPTGTIKKGFMWTVTVDGVFFTEQVRIGDSLIANIDTPTTLADWTRVQGNTDLATLTTVGLGNVNAGTGINVSYSNGTATVSSVTNSYAVTISNTATVTHNLGTLDVMIQLYDTVTNETVYADVVRASTNTVTVTFSVAPTNSVRVLVQK